MKCVAETRRGKTCSRFGDRRLTARNSRSPTAWYRILARDDRKHLAAGTRITRLGLSGPNEKRLGKCEAFVS